MNMLTSPGLAVETYAWLNDFFKPNSFYSTMTLAVFRQHLRKASYFTKHIEALVFRYLCRVLSAARVRPMSLYRQRLPRLEDWASEGGRRQATRRLASQNIRRNIIGDSSSIYFSISTVSSFPMAGPKAYQGHRPPRGDISESGPSP